MIKLKNILIVVKDISRSVSFYHDLFGLQVLLDQGSNVIMSEGLVLQEFSSWKTLTGHSPKGNDNSCELYFETDDLDSFLRKIESYMVNYVTKAADQADSRRAVRFYDPDGHMIEVREK